MKTMCDKKENEPMIVYLLRYVADQPRALMALLGFLAAGYMYVDLMSFVRESTMSMRELVTEVQSAREEIVTKVQSLRSELQPQMQEANTRLQHLEREHEAARKQDEH